MTTEGKPLSEAGSPVPLDLLRQEFLANGDAWFVLRLRSADAETLVRQAYAAHLAPAVPTGLAVLAVGGFGRGELFPHSDVDLCLLFAAEKVATANKAAISAFIQALWDGNLRLSHSVRTAAECCELHDHNIELNVSLLDQRLLCGDTELYSKFTPRLARFYEGQRLDLARRLCRLARSRHAQYQDTIYHLEPNVKEGPGGLRDLHLLGWFLRLEVPGMRENPWLEHLQEARNLLFQIRCYLHFRAGRDNNIFSFDAQEELAAEKFSSAATPEAWMRDYFENARRIQRAVLRGMEAVEARSSSLLASFRDWRSRLSNAEFTVARDRVYLKNPNLAQQQPELVMRLFQFVARHGIRLAHETERRIHDCDAGLTEYFRERRPLWPALREILALPHAALALRAMQETGVLTQIFPEWEGIQSCVVRDFYHRYTVDEHTLVAIESLQELARRQEPAHRRFATLLSEIEDLAVLRFAILFHDVGKGARSGEHTQESVRLAAAAAERICVPERQRRMILFLIEQHLVLSTAMTSRDLDDPTTARALAERAGTIEGLKYLTLLTYADISAVNPTALSPWRLEQLWRIYLATQRELTLELQSERISAPPEALDARQSFLKGLPVRYLRTHTEEEIRLHLELEERRKEAEIAIDIRKVDGGYQLTVLAKDRLNLFASVAGALASFGMNILKAEAFTNQQGTVVDTFVFEDPGRTLELNPPEMERLQLTLERVLLGKVQVKDLLRHRPKPAPPSKGSAFAPRVSFDNHAASGATLIEVLAEDRPGLLYDIASVLSNAGCNIELVLVDTEAHKALDVFYVSRNGRKLEDEALAALREAVERACRA